MWTKIKQSLKTLLPQLGELHAPPSIKQIVLRQEIRRVLDEIARRTPNNPVLWGHKVYSQTDEDGIIEEIFRRVGVGGRFFIEIGCGNGTENNSHNLLLHGWRGGWVDASATHVSRISRSFPLTSERLWVRNVTITVDNIVEVISEFLQWGGTSTPDFLSLDIDGNDLYVIGALAKVHAPRVLSVEYNAKFPPPLAISIAHNPSHQWMRDDYHGASLQAMVDALSGYQLVACNISGANAFFVRHDLAGSFEQYAVRDLYQPARHYLAKLRVGPAPSLKYLADLIKS